MREFCPLGLLFQIRSDTDDNFHLTFKKNKSFKYALQSFILQYPVSSASAEEGSPASEGLEGWIKYR